MKHVGRKLYHLMGGLGLLSLYFILGRERALLFYAALFLMVIVAETVRLAIPKFNRFVYTHFKGFIRQNEFNKITGTAPYILGIGLTLYLYSVWAATAAICFLAFGDVAATTVGERYGKTKIGDKSLEGTAAFLAASLLVGLFMAVSGVRLEPEVIVLGSAVAAVVELIPMPVNDNLVIPLVSGGVMELVLNWIK